MLWLANLLSISVSENEIGNRGLLALTRFRGLEAIYARKCDIDGKGLSKLSEDSFPRLEALDLADNAVGDEGMQHLDKFHRLKVLCLERTIITHQGLLVISCLKIAKSLRKLHLGRNKLNP